MSALPETLARKRIDEKLINAGWLIQDRDEMNRLAGLGVAVREYPLASGRCDYLLLVDGRACGIIEAKAAGMTLSGVEAQASGYEVRVPAALARWDDPLRFDYESNGEEILFGDRADPHRRSRPLFAFQQPETLLGWLRAGSSLRSRLRSLPALNPLGLRACQAEAIEGIEASLRHDRPRALVQMATGAGKTFTAATLSYRLLAHAAARRILFLVDRNNLGRQTLKEFQQYRPPGTGRLFTELYNVQRLGNAGLDNSAKVVISTIQRVFSQLTGTELDEEVEERTTFEHWTPPPPTIAYSARLPIEAFDVIVVDECHRSIYGSWRQLLDYFDAHVIGLTATPTPQTLGFFGQNLVAEYPYERSVVDQVNVAFEVFRIRTQIGEHGSRVEAGIHPADPRQAHRALGPGGRWMRIWSTPRPTWTAQSWARNQIRTVLQTFRDTLSTPNCSLGVARCRKP